MCFGKEERSESGKPGKNKVYEHLKKEIDLRAKNVPTKQNMKDQVRRETLIILSACFIRLFLLTTLETLQ